MAQLEEERVRNKPIRDSFAHGGGFFDQLVDSGVWDVASALGVPPDSSLVLNHILANRGAYENATRVGGEAALNALNELMLQLDAALRVG